MKIARLLRRLRYQRMFANETIVVIDGSSDSTGTDLARYSDILPNLRIIVQENQGRAAARNRGAAEAKYSLLIFLDDDMLPEQGFFQAHLDHHISRTDSILTGAAINSLSDNPFGRYQHDLSEKWSAPLCEFPDQPLPRPFITAANFSIPRNLFSTLGGFDMRLSDAEDLEFAWRASRSGVSLFYSHSAFAWHNDPCRPRQYIKRLRQYRSAHQDLIRLWPVLVGDRIVLPDRPASILKSVFFRMFANQAAVALIENDGIMRRIPQPLRSKLYDWAIAANSQYYTEAVSVNI